MAVANALELEEANLLTAEEQILLQRRQAASQSLARERAAAGGRMY